MITKGLPASITTTKWSYWLEMMEPNFLSSWSDLKIWKAKWVQPRANKWEIRRPKIQILIWMVPSGLLSKMHFLSCEALGKQAENGLPTSLLVSGVYSGGIKSIYYRIWMLILNSKFYIYSPGKMLYATTNYVLKHNHIRKDKENHSPSWHQEVLEQLR